VEAALDLSGLHRARTTQVRAEVRAMRVEHAHAAALIAMRDDLLAQELTREDPIACKRAGVTDEEPTVRKGGEGISVHLDEVMDVALHSPQGRLCVRRAAA
jgi:hypothetical protein